MNGFMADFADVQSLCMWLYVLCIVFFVLCRYKSESILEHSPETVFSYLDPLPNSNRLKWDPAVNNLEVVEEIDQVTHIITHTFMIFLSQLFTL